MELPANLKDWVSVAEGTLKGLGIIGAAGWAYFHYFRGRTYKSRLRVQVEGDKLYKGSDNYLLVSIEIENRGLSKVPLEQAGTGLRVLAHSDWTDPSNAEHLETLAIFKEHEWIEPGETIGDEKLVRLPTASILAVRLEFHLVSKDSSWTTLSIVPISLEKKDAKRKENLDESSEKGQGEGSENREGEEGDHRKEGRKEDA